MSVDAGRIAALRSRLAQSEAGGRPFDRLRVLEELVRAEPGEPGWWIRLGNAQFDVGRVEAAIRTFEAVLPRVAGAPELVLTLGHAYSAVGRTDDAVRLYRRLVGSGDDAHVNAGYWSLADLKGYAFDDREIADMQRRAGRPGGGRQRFLLMFALGRALEQRSRFAEAFDALREGNEEVAALRPYDGDGYRALAAGLLALQKVPQFPLERTGPTPIFIVGMPRSGSTLLEQMLASHSTVDATSELPFIENLARSLDQRGGFAHALARLTAAECRQAGSTYLDQVRPFLAGHPAAFVDKWPNNFWYVGLIESLFPDARVINVLRDPVDNAMGVYKQYFSFGNEHSARIEWIADYQEIYLEVMAHWDRLLPGKVLHLSYERLVREPVKEVRRLLDFCGLDFEEQVFEFHRTERAVMTPSGAQVRQPLYRDAIGSGLRYRDQLAPFLPRFEKIREAANRLLDG